MVINNNPEIDIFYEEYEKTKDSVKFVQSLKAVCNPISDRTDINSSASNTNQDDNLTKVI